MEIFYQLTRDDYSQGFKAFRRRTTYSRWVNRISYVSFFLVVAVALLLSFFGRDKSFSNLSPLWIIVAVWAYVSWYCRYRVANKMVKGSPSATLPHTVNISESGLHSRTSAAETRITWEVIVGWAEVERVFALFPSPLSFFPIPKRAMTDEQQSEFRTLLQSKVPRKK
jgi:YcxB-like protein